MDLVDKKATIFDVIGGRSLLYDGHLPPTRQKEAALNANSKLAYDIQWQEVLSSLAIGLPDATSLNQAELRKIQEVGRDRHERRWLSRPHTLARPVRG